MLLFLAVLDELVVLVFFAGAFLAALVVLAFLAGDFFAVVLAFLAVPDELVVLAFFAGAFLAGAFFAGAFFAAVLVVLAFLAGAFFAAVLLFLAALDELPVPTFLAAAPAALAGAVAAAATARTDGGFGMLAAVSFGSFLAPEMTFLSSWPALNFGTAFFFDFIRSPVCGLRTQRALRTVFSNEPNPVMATFSPRATSRVMVSSTDSSA